MDPSGKKRARERPLHPGGTRAPRALSVAGQNPSGAWAAPIRFFHSFRLIACPDCFSLPRDNEIFHHEQELLGLGHGLDEWSMKHS